MIITRYNLWQEVNVHCKKRKFGIRCGIIKEILISSAWVPGPGVLYKVEGKGLAGYYPEYQLESLDEEYEKLVMKDVDKNYEHLAKICREEN